MTPTRTELEAIAATLTDAHQDYTTNVSAPNWAVSTLCAAAAVWYCNQIQPKALCDLGSGFTSYTLRWWADTHGGTVTSVDDDLAWLNATCLFLRSHHLDSFNLGTYAEWRKTTDTYDLIVHDLAQGDLRNTSMWEAARRLNQGGIILFDDAQHGNHQEFMWKLCDEFGFTLTLLDEQTRDGIGRFSAVAQ